MVETGLWIVPGLPEDCRGPAPELRTRQLLHLQWGTVRCRGEVPNHRFGDRAPLRPGVDDGDWRFVEFVTVPRDADLDEPPFFDVEAWRHHGPTVHTRLPRVGFATSPAFLNGWETNPDNGSRVTTHQALIAALGSTFAVTEPTVPPPTDGRATDHADPATDCFGCHRQLDPMRRYFANAYAPSGMLGADDPEPAAFAFGGVVHDGGDLAAFGDVLAAHPAVAAAWTQKLCWVANGRPCPIDDPEFQRVTRQFAARGSWRDLVVELLASPLVTGLASTTSPAPPVRPQHHEPWCRAVADRGSPGCERPRIDSALAALAGISWQRGSVDPTVPQHLDTVAMAGLATACERLASVEVGPDRPFDPTAPDLVAQLLTHVVGLPEGHERYAPLRDELEAHREVVHAASSDAVLAARSTYLLACSTPDAAAVGL